MQPSILLDALERVVAKLRPITGLSIAISGSVARRAADKYSDLDVWLIVQSPEQLHVVQSAARTAIEELGSLITTFPASHLGLERLHIFFIEIDEQIVKVDVEVLLAKDFRPPREIRALHDPEGIVAGATPIQSALFDPELANRRVAGWLWYAYGKIARGELFEGVDALDVLRKVALVPLMLHRHNATLEGYRRLEDKLTAAELDRLRATYPSKVAAPEVLRALISAGHMFRDVYRDAAPEEDASAGLRRLDRMLAAIERDRTIV